MEHGYRPCPRCAEPIRNEARFCKHCGHRVFRTTPTWRWVLYGILGASALGLFFYYLGHSPEVDRQNEKLVQEMANIQLPRVPHKRELSTGEIFTEASPSVVLIEVFDAEGQKRAFGSGFVVSSDGSVLTNYHVIRGAYSAVAHFSDNRTASVLGVVGYDQERDVAIVTIASTTARPLRLGSASSLKVGDKLVALGSPEGLQDTASEGIVSAMRGGRIQMSTPISPGSSGGPVLDTYGNVVGIAVAAMRGGENLNFAVPIDWARRYIGRSPSESLAQVAEKNTVSQAVFTGPISVPARRRQVWNFQVNPNQMSDAELDGKFQSSGGLDGLITVDVVCNPGGVLYNSQRVRSGQLHAYLPPAEPCALIFDNTASMLFARTVTGTIALRYVK